MPRRIESLFIEGPAGRLEALLEEPEASAPHTAALVCHPHPQHGGTMHNKVVYRIARGLRHSGHVVLRFNYRGVNLSDGEYAHGAGETDDARVCLAFLRERYPDLTASIAGFSFGSRIALRLAAEIPRLQRVIAVGFPTVYPDRAYVSDVRIPKFFIQSKHDAFGPQAELTAFFASLPEPKELRWIDAADHFFAGNLDGLEAAIVEIGNGA